jgi:aryl-alcohol dehydrogenase-like predicted oxidoreductase
VANGRLAPGGQDGSPGAARAAELAEGLGVPVDQLAIAAALAQPWAGRVLSGAVDGEQLASNVAAAALPIPAELAEELADLAEEPGPYWKARSARSWA